MRKIFPLSTERLILRPLRTEDLCDFFDYRSLEIIYRHQGFHPTQHSDVASFFNALSPDFDVPDSKFQIAICLNAPPYQLIGDIGLHFIDAHQVEIGYTLAPDFQGHGYAYEAVKVILDTLFTDLNKHRVFATLVPENARSQALIEKLGFRREAYYVKSVWVGTHWSDDCLYAILKDEWS